MEQQKGNVRVDDFELFESGFDACLEMVMDRLTVLDDKSLFTVHKFIGVLKEDLIKHAMEYKR